MKKWLAILTILQLISISNICGQELQLKVIPWGQIQAEKKSSLPWKDNTLGLSIGVAGVDNKVLTNLKIDYLQNQDKNTNNSFLGFKSIVTGSLGFGYAIARKQRINFPILINLGYSVVTQKKINTSVLGFGSLGVTAQCRFYVTHKICLLGGIHYSYEYTESDNKIINDLYELGAYNLYTSLGIGINLSKKGNIKMSDTKLK